MSSITSTTNNLTGNYSSQAQTDITPKVKTESQLQLSPFCQQLKNIVMGLKNKSTSRVEQNIQRRNLTDNIYSLDHEAIKIKKSDAKLQSILGWSSTVAFGAATGGLHAYGMKHKESYGKLKSEKLLGIADEGKMPKQWSKKGMAKDSHKLIDTFNNDHHKFKDDLNVLSHEVPSQPSTMPPEHVSAVKYVPDPKFKEWLDLKKKGNTLTPVEQTKFAKLDTKYSTTNFNNLNIREKTNLKMSHEAPSQLSTMPPEHVSAVKYVPDPKFKEWLDLKKNGKKLTTTDKARLTELDKTHTTKFNNRVDLKLRKQNDFKNLVDHVRDSYVKGEETTQIIKIIQEIAPKSIKEIIDTFANGIHGEAFAMAEENQATSQLLQRGSTLQNERREDEKNADADGFRTLDSLKNMC